MPDYRNGTDQVVQWIEVARHGSSEALGQLLEAFRPYLLKLANEQLPSDLRAKAGASDLVQQTFLEAQQDFGDFRGGSQKELAVWLRRILANNVVNLTQQYHGTAKRQVGREVTLGPADSGRTAADGLVSPDLTPSGLTVAKEEAEAFEQALERLPEDYRQVIVLRHREGRSFAEIGQLLNRSGEAARKLWARAIRKLQQELDSRK